LAAVTIEFLLSHKISDRQLSWEHEEYFSEGQCSYALQMVADFSNSGPE
jgi:hypothetical protein